MTSKTNLLRKPIQNIWAIGRNYADHAKELGNTPGTSAQDPLIFLKAGSGIVENQKSFHLPKFSNDVHHEVEITLQFGEDLSFSGITLGIDVTARDAQNRLKKAGSPWTLAKSFKESCLLGPMMLLAGSSIEKALQEIEFFLKINGEVRQKGNSRDMIHSIEQQRSYVLECFPVVPGDLLMTGTPAGVGPIRSGDVLEAEIPGFLQASWRVI